MTQTSRSPRTTADERNPITARRPSAWPISAISIVTARPLGWRVADWFNKRVTGWINLAAFGRGRRFARADEIVTALMAELRQSPPDRVVFSGDATALGFASECGRAATLLGLTGPRPAAGLGGAGQSRLLRRPRRSLPAISSAASLRGWSANASDEAAYPFAQRVGPLWLIGVNSSVANRLPWDASGRTGEEQMARLEQLLARLAPGPRILVTHYPSVVIPAAPRSRITDCAT